MTRGLVEEATAPSGVDPGPHPGKERRYFQLTEMGRSTVKADARRQEAAVELARQ